MNNNYLKLSDTLSGKEGVIFLTTPDGQNKTLFEIVQLDAKISFNKSQKTTLGNFMKQTKIVGAEGTGTLKMYLVSSDYVKMAIDYLRKGIMGELKIQLINEDRQSSIGRQNIVLTGVVLDEILLGKIDVDSEDPIMYETGFSFYDVELLESFTSIF